jgi:transposase InsO family protein
MQAEVKVARQRLSVLELAQKLGNVSDACRRRGMTRTQFYEYKKRFETQGLEGLKDLPPIHKTHPQTTSPEVEAKVVELSLVHPAKGCSYIASLLALAGVKLSGVTVQRILNDHELGTKLERWLALEKQHLEQTTELTAQQVAFVEAQNPQFKERHVESSKPGELINQDTYYVGQLEGIGKVYLHSVVDTYGSMAWGLLHTTKQPEAAASVLYNDVLPFYKKHGLKVEAVLTDNGREFCGTSSHPFEVFLELNSLSHRRIKPRTPRTNGFVERFHKTVGEEFFGPALRSTRYETVDQLQTDLDDWLDSYNYERPHLGYRNHGHPNWGVGRRPFDTVKQFIKIGYGFKDEPPTLPSSAPANGPVGDLVHSL